MSNQEPEVELAVGYSEDKECEIRGEILIETMGVLDASFLKVDKMEDLVERLKDHPFGKEVREMANCLKIALEMIDKQNQKLDIKDKIISELQQQLLVVTRLKNQTEELADINEVVQKNEYERHISVALVMVNQLQKELEVAQGQSLEILQERQKFENVLSMRANKIRDLESKMKDVDRKLGDLHKDNEVLRKKLEYAVQDARKSTSDYGAEMEKCYQQDLRASEEIQKYKRIIGCVEGEIEQLNKRCGQCKMARVGKEIDRLRKQMGLPKLNVSATENVSSECTPGNMGSKCVVCGETFSRSLDVTDYIRLLIITG